MGSTTHFQSFTMSLIILIATSYTKASVYKFCLLNNLDELVEYLDIDVFVDTELEPSEQREIRKRCQQHLALESIGLDDTELKEILSATTEARGLLPELY